ncbi:MAG: A/G-specific adenine glycosylase [Pseudomonadota bacterium]|nr:A/G-specific adenine glycosylase [Pseudomonadota bacterium]MED5436646.1 A/G-specific adenine glycosylase [Pseudomonadota bacterium]
MSKNNLSKKVLIWYDKNRRDLPWRKVNQNSDPYETWISEVMLQQTTVEAVKPYFRKFLSKWPTIQDLAKSNINDVMDMWSGLGYYSRAKNIHKSSQIITKNYNGKFPNTYDELIKLPGIGPYTAGAILTIAFNKDAVVIDANIERILLRLNGILLPLKDVKEELRELASTLNPEKRIGDYVQALMDIGSKICKPKNPNCSICPIKSNCKSLKNDLTQLIPLKEKVKARPIKEAELFWIVSNNDKIFLRRRSLTGLLPGMLEFPSSEWISTSKKRKSVAFPFSGKWESIPGKITHTFSHFELSLKIYISRGIDQNSLNGLWEDKENLNKIGLPSLMRKVYRHVLSKEGISFE